MNKRFWVIVCVIVAVFAGTVWARDNKKTDTVSSEGTHSSHIIGKADAKVSLVEYSDFQCPACKAYYPMVEQVIQKYQDRISFEYRHYPLTAIHRNAFIAARASEAAAKQNKFWEMYRMLFTNQSAWENTGNAQVMFEDYARRLGLNVSQFKTDLVSSKTNAAINADITSFNGLHLTKATPTFLLNGKKIQPETIEEFSRLIDVSNSYAVTPNLHHSACF